MLTELVVEGLGVIERADLTLEPGSTALTGETGAGKTLVVAALGLLLGGRADRSLVRSGAAGAAVEGRFVVPATHPAAALAAAHDALEGGEGEVEIVLARSIGADGRGRARLNGRLVTAGVLGEVAGSLVEIAGQHEHARVAEAGVQRALLDAYAGPEALDLARRVGAGVRAAREAERARERAGAETAAGQAAARALEEEIAAIESAAVRAGEAEELAAQVARLENAEAIASALGHAADVLRRDAGAHELLEEAARAAEGAAVADAELTPLVERLRAASIEVDDLARDLRAAAPAPDAGALEAGRERLATLARLRRRYGLADDPEAHLDRARARAAELRERAAEEDRLAAEHERLVAEAERLAARLTSLRRDAAHRLARELPATLATLALPQARVDVVLSARDLYEGGWEGVDISVALNPGEDLRPVAKVASGGELARLTLALRLLAGRASVTTLVFDEIDAGIGGEAARAVGRALADLARGSAAQVLVVTHLPQVAAFAETHMRVTKEAQADRTIARVERLDDEGRVAELSRMLAGLPSGRARGHARELLEMAAVEAPR